MRFATRPIMIFFFHMSDQPYIPPPFRAPEPPKVPVSPLPSPVVPVPASVDLPTTVTPGTPKKKSKFPLIILFVVVVLALLGAGVWAYFTFLVLSPKQVMAKMIEAFGSVDTFAFEGSATVELPEQGEPKKEGEPLEPPLPFTGAGSFSVMFSGAVDATDETNVDGYAEIDVSVEDFSFGFEVRNIGKDTYVKADTLPPFVAMLGPPERLSNQWIRFHADEILGGLGLGEFKKKLDEKAAEAQEGSYELTDEQKEELLAAFLDAEVVKITQKFKVEKIGEISSYHYAFTFDPDALESFLIRANEIVPESPIAEDKMNDILEKFEGVDVSGEIWVGKKDFLPRKFVVTSVPDDETKGSATLPFEILFDAYNEAVSIEEPADAKAIAEFIQEFMEAERKDTDKDGLRDQEEERLGTDSNNPDTDGDGLQDGRERRYRSDPLNSDTDGDGYLDGAEVTNGYSPTGEGKLEPPSIIL